MATRSNTRSNISRIAVEILTIIFSVLVALGVNEWRLSRANSELAASTLVEIQEELEANGNRMESSLESNKALLDNLKAELSALSEDPSKDISYSFNYHQTFLRTRAWQSAVVTQAVGHMDLSHVQEITDIYELIDGYKVHEQRVLASMGSSAFYAEENLENQLSANLFNILVNVQLGEIIVAKIDAFLGPEEIE